VACESVASLPFGDGQVITPLYGYGCYNDSNLHFTGKERDSESGLDNFGARFNSSSFGRFTSADWSPSPEPIPYGSLGNPNSLDLYSYVRNNPVTLADRDGHLPDSSCPSSLKQDYWGSWPTSNCPQPPPKPQPKKPSTDCTYAFDACMPGSLNAEAQPNLALMKHQGPGSSTYAGFSMFSALSCAAKKDPTDPACWGVTVTPGPGTFQWSWSAEAYGKAALKPFTYILTTQQTQQGISTTLSGPIITPPDPLDPIQELINPKPGPLPSPTSRAYVCPAIEAQVRQLQLQSANPSAAQGLAALQALYRKSCL
jgi:RHS repeat-associated protein